MATTCVRRCSLYVNPLCTASVLESASVTQRGVGGRQQTDNKQIYIGKAPAVSGQKPEQVAASCLSGVRVKAHRPSPACTRSLISSLTTACARKSKQNQEYGRFGSVDLISHQDCTHQCWFSPLHEVVESASWF